MSNEFTRREFLTVSAKIAAMMGLGTSAVSGIAQALSELVLGKQTVLWVQAQSCSGCTVSFLNSSFPDPAEILTQYISLRFNSTISVSNGSLSLEVISNTIQQGDYFLVVEGSIPVSMPEACMIGGEPAASQILRAVKNAKYVLAVGNCAAFGGIPAAENNQTGAMSLENFLMTRFINAQLINLPGCPVHPDWLVGTLAYLIKFGMPQLDDQKRPLMFYSRYVHDQCPRFADYERESFAQYFSDAGCLFKLGCVGPNIHGDCTLRHWNSGVNSCINAGAPCIGCTDKNFAAVSSFPFYRKGEDKFDN